MTKREIRVPRGYDVKTQSKVGLFAAQLDDQLKRLKNSVKELSVTQLEWQQQPGMNTIGMLVAHLVVADIWWIKLAPAGIPWEPDGKRIIQRSCGFEDDGLPMPPDGRHTKFLQGYTSEKYLGMLVKARQSIHRELKTWRDRDLDKLYSQGKWRFSRMWTLYHVLEHFAAHLGQILMIKHMMRDAGILVVQKK